MLHALSPIWVTIPETARRVRQWIGTELNWAKAAGHRSGDNPIDSVAKGLLKQGERDELHTALPYAEVPAFVARLRSSEQGETARLPFEFQILTAGHTSEVLGASWIEFDEVEALWTMPAVRMKAGRQHRVTLSARASEILTRARLLGRQQPALFPRAFADQAAVQHDFLDGSQADQDVDHALWLPIVVQRLGGRGDKLAPRSCGDGAGPHCREQS